MIDIAASSEPGILYRAKGWLGAVVVQFIVAELLSFFCGWLPEAKFSDALVNSGWEAYSPAIACAGLLLGFWVSPSIMHMKGAKSTWIVGVLWLVYGLFDSANGWSPSSSSQPTRWAYAATQLFGKTESCGGSECLGELIFTTPCAVAIAYSVGALAYSVWKNLAGSAD